MDSTKKKTKKKKSKSDYQDSFEHADENYVSNSSKFKNLVEKAKYFIQNPEKINEVITEAYNKATNESGNRTIKEMWGKLLTLFRMVKAHFNGSYTELGQTKVMMGIGIVLYFILPFDVVPDFIPLVGYMDDASLLAWFIKTYAKEVDKFQKWESNNIKSETPAY